MSEEPGSVLAMVGGDMIHEQLSPYAGQSGLNYLWREAFVGHFGCISFITVIFGSLSFSFFLSNLFSELQINV